jgi:hypothetical protein
MNTCKEESKNKESNRILGISYSKIRYKNILLLGIIISLLSIITGCEHIEDTNGENTNLTTITMEKLAGKTISIRSSGFSKNITRKNITILSQHADIDVDSLVMKGGLASGIGNLMATELKQGQKLRIDCKASVESGNLGIIMISPDNEVLYNFKIGAESFKGEISLKRTIG